MNGAGSARHGIDRSFKMALIGDDLTAACLPQVCDTRHLHPLIATWTLRRYRPQVLFVESTWAGLGNRWKYKIASYPDHPERNNRVLARLVKRARDLGIVTVFWNKEDGVHFERFIDSASLFDVVLTVDENCLPRYRERLGVNVKLGVLPFAVLPSIHHPVTGGPPLRRANFAGSYSRHIHDRRRGWQDMLFHAARPLGLTVYDRNSSRKAEHYRYPPLPWMDVRPAVPYERTADIYRQHALSINVNTVEDSATMFSRRLVEIIACGGLALTPPSPAVSRYFADYCLVVHNASEAREAMARIARDGLSRQDRERARAGADYVLRHHTWAHRLQDIQRIVAP